MNSRGYHHLALVMACVEMLSAVNRHPDSPEEIRKAAIKIANVLEDVK